MNKYCVFAIVFLVTSCSYYMGSDGWTLFAINNSNDDLLMGLRLDGQAPYLDYSFTDDVFEYRDNRFIYLISSVPRNSHKRLIHTRLKRRWFLDKEGKMYLFVMGNTPLSYEDIQTIINTERFIVKYKPTDKQLRYHLDSLHLFQYPPSEDIKDIDMTPPYEIVIGNTKTKSTIGSEQERQYGAKSTKSIVSINYTYDSSGNRMGRTTINN